jgi:opacity protein-like surface antigen
MTARPLAAAVLVLALAASASAANGSVLTERDSGKTFTVRRGHELTLRLSGRYVWSDPKVRGGSITLTPVSSFTDPGFQEWTITTRATGQATIGTHGDDQVCDGCAARRFHITVVVR